MQMDQFPYGDEYDWQNRELIGQGGFAYVYKVKNKQNGCYYAVKQFEMYKFDQDFKLQALDTQIKAMKQCQSPFIVKMYKFYKGKTYTYMVLELCQQNLKQYMDKKLMLLQPEAAIVISNIVSAYRIIQMSSYIHRDLKPKNILLKNSCFKITDFGFAKKYSYNFEKLCEVCGTQLYMAPQLLYCKQYTDKCDVWSLGLMLFELLFGYLPWCTIHNEIYKKEVVSRDVSFPYHYAIGQNTKDFIQKCLQLQQSDRISWKQVYEHPFVRDKDPGKIIKYKEISVNLQNILGRVQNSNYRNYVNAKRLFKNYESQLQMDRQRFYQFLIELDPQITSYQSNEIFQVANESKTGLININEFKKFYLQIDYRPPQDAASKRIQEIIKIAQSKNMKGNDLFRILDTDKSSHLSQKQFCREIRKIAPMLEDRQLQIIWKKMDQDNSGIVTWRQFLQSTIRDLTVNEKVHFKNYERALRNVLNLRQFFVQKNIIAHELFQVKKGNSNIMTLDEFGKMIKAINYSITRDQIVEMFRLIDSNDSQSIDILEMQKLLQGQIIY